MSYVGRFAPSPTGGLHWGNLLVAFCSWARAYRAGGKCILRIEDIDTPRVLPHSQQEIIDDLNYLGLNFNEGPVQGGPHGSYLQSECLPFYEVAAARLKAQNRLFACVCSRKELQSIASAPHPGEEGPPYPGICREKSYDLMSEKPPVAWRFKVDSGEVQFLDIIAGVICENVKESVGDFVIKRKDGLWAYHLAVVVDDIRQGVTEIVRGRDLLSSTARQIQLYRALGATTPDYFHVPLWCGSDGKRLSKRRGQNAQTIGFLRREGRSATELLGMMGHALGIAERHEKISAENLADRLEVAVLKKETIHHPFDGQ